MADSPHTANILTFRKPGNWIEGAATCMKCRAEWVEVIAEAALIEQHHWLTCPSCGAAKGHMKYLFTFGNENWVCSCGADVFRITPKFIYCPNCGREQDFSKAPP